eukprot:PLAT7717.2.p1 GENE.PLAT7717.2~~PLAT7717.2.p1  ORF type:complete len:1031 (-),score=382.39 PLAT7717.2:36-2717(-)
MQASRAEALHSRLYAGDSDSHTHSLLSTSASAPELMPSPAALSLSRAAVPHFALLTDLSATVHEHYLPGRPRSPTVRVGAMFHHAALTIQCAWRASCARAIVWGYAGLQQQHAARVIQRAVRRRLSNVRMYKTRWAATLNLQSAWRRKMAYKQASRRRYAILLTAATTRIQAFVRAWRARKRVALLRAARRRRSAMTIQAAYRGRRGRLRAARRRAMYARGSQLVNLVLQLQQEQRRAAMEAAAAHAAGGSEHEAAAPAAVTADRSKKVKEKEKDEAGSGDDGEDSSDDDDDDEERTSESELTDDMKSALAHFASARVGAMATSAAERRLQRVRTALAAHMRGDAVLQAVATQFVLSDFGSAEAVYRRREHSRDARAAYARAVQAVCDERSLGSVLPLFRRARALDSGGAVAEEMEALLLIPLRRLRPAGHGALLQAILLEHAFGCAGRTRAARLYARFRRTRAHDVVVMRHVRRFHASTLHVAPVTLATLPARLAGQQRQVLLRGCGRHLSVSVAARSAAREREARETFFDAPPPLTELLLADFEVERLLHVPPLVLQQRHMRSLVERLSLSCGGRVLHVPALRRMAQLRARAARRLRAVLLVQRVFRRLAARNAAALAAALAREEMRQRGASSMRVMRAHWEEHTDAIVKLQAAVRASQARRHYAQSRSALLKLQSVVRGFLARRLLRAKRRARAHRAWSGPEIVELHRGWHSVSGVELFFVVTRCGLNLLLRAVSRGRDESYEALFDSTHLHNLLILRCGLEDALTRRFALSITSGRLRLTTAHFGRLLQLLFANLSFLPAMKGPAGCSSRHRRVLSLDVSHGAAARGSSVLENRRRPRVWELTLAASGDERARQLTEPFHDVRLDWRVMRRKLPAAKRDQGRVWSRAEM